MEYNQTLDLFDGDIITDINKTFPESDADKARKAEEEKTKKKTIPKEEESVANNTISPLDRLEEETTESKDDSTEETEEEVEEKVEEKEETEEVTPEEKQLLQQVVDLKEMGALLLPEDYEVESLEKAVEDSENYRNSLAIKTVFSQIPDVEIPGVGNSKDLFVYMFEHGGTDIPEFSKTFGSNSFDPTKFNLEKEEDRRKILDILYESKGFNEAKRKKLIDKTFDDLEDETEAREALTELTDVDNRNKKAVLDKLANEKKIQAKEAEDTYNQMSNILQKKESIAGYPMAKDERPKALNSIFRQVNIDGQAMTEFDYRLKNLVLKNPELTLALSAILNTISQDKNKGLFFDLSKFERKEKTKAVKNLKEITGRVAAGKKKFTSASDNDDATNKKFNWGSVVGYEELI